MKIGFTGDLVLQDLEKLPSEIFGNFRKYIDSKEINLCVNLESPFIKKGMTSFKNKVVLYAYESQYRYIDFLSPHLVNLGNNHINDFGNESSSLSIEILNKNQQAFFGIGYKDKKENVFIDTLNNHIYISFCTRSSDLTGSRLFSEEEFIGPYDVDYDQINFYKCSYSNFKIVVNIHWGLEDIAYPEPEKRNIAHKIIDSGANLIIGHHSHKIQPFEIYKDSYIYYSIGNFYFNDISFELNNKNVFKRALKHQKCGIIPIFDADLHLLDVLEIKIISNSSLEYRECYKPKEITNSVEKYTSLYKYYFFFYNLLRKFVFICKNLDYVFYRIFHVNINKFKKNNLL